MKYTLFILLISTSAIAQPILTTGPAAGSFPMSTMTQSGDTITLDMVIGPNATEGNVATIDLGMGGDYDVSMRLSVGGKLVYANKSCLHQFIYLAVSGGYHPAGTKIKAVYILKKSRV